MAKLSLILVSLPCLLPLSAWAQSSTAPVWGQCGGMGFSGPTTCAAGSVCTVVNPWYSQCIPGTDSTTPPVPEPSSSIGLHVAAKAAGKLYFGSATDNPELPDAAYVNLLSDTKEFGQITPGNSIKWDATEPSRGQFTFTNGDVVTNLAKKNGQILRGHNCVWHNQLPSWVSNGGFNATELTSIIETHCSTVVGHYKGQIYSWDVVNEPFNDDGTWRSDVFFNTLGSSYVATALKAARSADPNAKLYINDYNIEYTGAKSNAMLDLAKSLKAQGVPLDGVGFQAHLIVGQVPSDFAQVLARFTALGLEVAITELDIRMTLPATDALLEQQRKDYQSVVAACAALEGCVGITVWDYTDKYSWVPSTFSGQGAALPWDENLNRKPAYDGILAGLGAL